MIHIAPAPGHGPGSVIFAGKEHPALHENRRPGIHLGRLIARFVAEQAVHLFHGQIGFQGQHFGGYPAQFRVAFPVVCIPAVLPAWAMLWMRIANSTHGSFMGEASYFSEEISKEHNSRLQRKNPPPRFVSTRF